MQKPFMRKWGLCSIIRNKPVPENYGCRFFYVITSERHSKYFIKIHFPKLIQRIFQEIGGTGYLLINRRIMLTSVESENIM